MSLDPGTRLGPYEIAGAIGAGGLGEVYRARDPRLERDVAVKVLPASFASDPDRLRRFEQEARATGALNHPNILAVHDVGSHAGAPFVVSELLEGDTLRERVGGTALPVRKAIEFASQIARGLAAAHDKGIVHRDLKPDNVFVTRDGRVKILDFGLAKLVPTEGLSEAETHTRGAPGTDAGKVLGTVGYMSPEQVRAQPADHRSDIFSFGSVLYEMLSGRRAFRGASAIETMNAILKEDPPPLSETNRNLPPALERIVSHCLEKNPEERFQSARDIAFDLEQLSGSTAGAAPISGKAPARVGLPLLAGAVLLALGLGALGGRASIRRASEAPSIERLTFRREEIRCARFTPDGRSMVFESVLSGEQDPALFMVQEGSPEARPLGLPNAHLAGISSKGETAVLLRRRAGGSRTLAVIPPSGGAPRDVVEDVEQADWAPDGGSLAVLRWTGGGLVRLEFPPGKELYAANNLKDIRVSPRGDRIAFTEHPVMNDNRGDVVVVDLKRQRSVLSTGWTDLGNLAWSRDGREVLFSATRRGSEHSIYGATLEGRERQVYRVPGSVDVEDVAADGRLLLSVRQGQPRIFGRAHGAPRDKDLSWLDYSYVRFLSRDGRTLLFDEQGLGGGEGYSAYVRSMDGGPPVRLGTGSGLALSPDGRWAIVLDLSAPDHAVLLPTGAGQARKLPKGRLAQLHHASFAEDGRQIVLGGNEAGRDLRMWVQSVDGGDPRPISEEGVGGPPSPDLAWAAVETPQGYQIVRLDGSQPPRIVPGLGAYDQVLGFTRDGRSLVVRGRGRQPARMLRVEIATGRRTELAMVGPGEGAGGRVSSVEITDDGGAYAYTFVDPLNTLYVASGLR
jgi:Tol biopolymer transport system component